MGYHIHGRLCSGGGGGRVSLVGATPCCHNDDVRALGHPGAVVQVAAAQAETTDLRAAADTRIAELNKALGDAQREASTLRGRMEPLMSECTAYRKVCVCLHSVGVFAVCLVVRVRTLFAVLLLLLLLLLCSCRYCCCWCVVFLWSYGEAEDGAFVCASTGWFACFACFPLGGRVPAHRPSSVGAGGYKHCTLRCRWCRTFPPPTEFGGHAGAAGCCAGRNLQGPWYLFVLLRAHRHAGGGRARRQPAGVAAAGGRPRLWEQ